MPKECLKCGFLAADEAVEVCGRCHAPDMRFTLLSGLHIDDSPSKRMTATIGGGPEQNFLARVGQVFRFFLFSTVAAFVLTGTFVSVLPDDLFDKTRLTRDTVETATAGAPGLAIAAVFGLPPLAVGAGVLTALRGAHLAQQVALVFSPIISFGLLVVLGLAGVPISILAWAAVPVLSAAVGFALGLRMANVARPVESRSKRKVEYKVVDAWDRKAKPRFRRLPSRDSAAFNKLLLGVALWGMTYYGGMFWLQALLSTGPNIPVDVDRARSVFRIVAVAVGALGAAAGSRAPIVQGIALGLVVAAIQSSISFDPMSRAWWSNAALDIVFGIVGGIFAGICFKPPRSIRGKILDGADRLAYEVDDPTIAEHPPTIKAVG